MDSDSINLLRQTITMFLAILLTRQHQGPNVLQSKPVSARSYSHTFHVTDADHLHPLFCFKETVTANTTLFYRPICTVLCRNSSTRAWYQARQADASLWEKKLLRHFMLPTRTWIICTKSWPGTPIGGIGVDQCLTLKTCFFGNGQKL